MTKICRKCERELSLDSFSSYYAKLKDGTRKKYYRRECKECFTKTYNRTEYHRSESWYYVCKRVYGLEPEQADAMLAGGCKVCGTHDGKLCIDHDHNTGRVRGCLCDNCNKALGHAKDDPLLLRKLADYLEVHND